VPDPLLDDLGEDSLVRVQDADTVLDPDFVRCAVDALADTGVGAVGGVFHGEQGGGLLGLLQRMDVPAPSSREVREARRTCRIGGGDGVYSLASLTEDDEMTKAVKTLRYRTVSLENLRGYG
jgi:biofilm PGA synthesis N-glycosyltransferase PgaC